MARLTLLGAGIAMIIGVIIIAGFTGLFYSTKTIKEAKKPPTQLVEIKSAIILVEEGDRETHSIKSIQFNMSCDMHASIPLDEMKVMIESADFNRTFAIGNEEYETREIVSSDGEFAVFSGNDVYEIKIDLNGIMAQAGQTVNASAFMGESPIGSRAYSLPFLQKGYMKIN